MVTTREPPDHVDLRHVSVPTALLWGWALVMELAAFGVLGYAGWQLGSGIGRLVLVFAAPLAAILVWWLFVAPKAKVALPPRGRLAVELLVYAAAVGGLLLAGATVAGIAAGVLVAGYQIVRHVARRHEVQGLA